MNTIQSQLCEVLESHLSLNAKGWEADADNFEHEKIWSKEVEILSKNLDTTLEYLDSIESAEELEALSEIIDSLVPVFGKRKEELIACFRRNNNRLQAGLDEYLEGF